MVKGVASFTSLRVTKAGVGYTLVAEATGASAGQPFAIAEGPAGFPELVSVAQNGTDLADRRTYQVCISGDGRHVGFTSLARNLDGIVETSDDNDVFLRDREAATSERVTVAATGGELAGGDANAPAISADGSVVAFDSSSPNVVPGDQNSGRDIFARLRATSATVCVSCAADGTVGNRESFGVSLSADGRFAAFVSDATNLVKGDFNGNRDGFVKDLTTGVVVRVNVQRNGAQTVGHHTRMVAISGDGRLVALITTAPLTAQTNYEDQVFVARNPLAP